MNNDLRRVSYDIISDHMTLNKMNIMTHYDDSINVLIDIRMKYKKITLYHVNPYIQKIVKI